MKISCLAPWRRFRGVLEPAAQTQEHGAAISACLAASSQLCLQCRPSGGRASFGLHVLRWTSPLPPGFLVGVSSWWDCPIFIKPAQPCCSPEHPWSPTPCARPVSQQLFLLSCALGTGCHGQSLEGSNESLFFSAVLKSPF